MYKPEEECVKLLSAIKRLCKIKGLSQNKLARKAEISSSTLSSLLNGKTSPYVHTIYKLCNALDVKLEELLGCGEIGKLSDDERKLVMNYEGMPDYKKRQLFIFIDMLKNYEYGEG